MVAPSETDAVAVAMLKLLSVSAIVTVRLVYPDNTEPPVTLVRDTTKDSLVSIRLSWIMGTVMVLLVSPALNVRVPLVPLKSAAPAVPL